MAYAGTLENRLHDSLDRVGHAALSGPGVGSLLLGSVVFVNEANFRLGNVHQVSFDWQIILRLAICVLCGLYGLAHIRQTGDTLLRFPGAWGLLFAVWTIITIPLAINPPHAAASAVCLGCIILFAPAAIAQLGGRRIVVSILAALSIYMVLSWVAYFVSPTLGRTEYIMPDLSIVLRFGGLNHSNTTGRLAALGIGLLLSLGCLRVVPWRDLYIYFIGFGICLYATNSRTSMLAAAAVALLHFSRFAPRRRRDALFLAAPVVALAIGIGLASGAIDADAIVSKFTRTGDAEELYSLTGRTGVWESVVAAIGDSPIIGYGHGCARFVMATYNEELGQDVAGYHAHNLLLNVILGSGFVGGLLLLAMALNQAIALLKHPDIIPDLVLVLIVVGGVSDAVMLNPIPDSHTLLWFIALFWRQMGASLVADPEPALAAGVAS
jgi:exopolysaccharide production protein ExoQ